MKLVSKGTITETFDTETKINFSANGEEFRLILSTFDLIGRSVREKHRYPNCFGGSDLTQMNITAREYRQYSLWIPFRLNCNISH
jgi:hypothetical protein